MRAVTGRMCLLKRANLLGAIFNETVFKDTAVAFAAICQSERERAATGDFGRNPADGFRIERMQGAGLTAASGGFNWDELL